MNEIKFKKADEIFISKFNNELAKNKTKSIILKSIIQHKNVHWYIKTKDKEKKYKEILASIIARQLRLNTVNIIEINEADFNSIKSIDGVKLENGADSENTYLIRLVQSYNEEDIPIKNLDEAMASELVFSLWIRKRDTHADNKVFINNIPVFFDFNVAFGKKDVNKFFENGKMKNGKYKNWGYAGCWCIITKKTLEEIKNAKDEKICYHLIKNIDNFQEQLDRYCKKIKQCDIKEIFNKIRNIDNQSKIEQFLVETQMTISEDCEVLKNILKIKNNI